MQKYVNSHDGFVSSVRGNKMYEVNTDCYVYIDHVLFHIG